MTSQGSAYGRLRRALDTGNPTIALAAAAELDFVSLPDALEIVLLLLVDEPGKFRRAALRWHARYCGEIRDVGFEEAHAVLACLAGLASRRPKAAASALAEPSTGAGSSAPVRFCSGGLASSALQDGRARDAALDNSAGGCRAP